MRHPSTLPPADVQKGRRVDYLRLMGDQGSDSYLDPYREAVGRHGPGFEATLWGSREAQVLRFDVMVDLAGFESCVVLDAGCGEGDFAARLLEREVPFERFVGVDAVPEMIESARRRDLPRCVFEARDVVADPAVLSTGGPDFVCISGALNTMDEPVARRLVAGAFEAAAQGVVFNFLSDRHHPKWNDRNLGPAHRFDTLAWLDWAFGKTCRVSFTQDYLDGHDATIMMRHE